MTDDLERRLRTSLSGSDLPSAPDSLHDALDRLPDDAGPIGTGGQRWRLAWVMPALVIVVVVALIAAWLPGGILGPAGPTASPRGSQSPVPSASQGETMPTFWPLAADLVGPSSVAVVGWVVNFEATLRPDLFYELVWSDNAGATWRTVGSVPAGVEQAAHTGSFLAPIHLRFGDASHGWLSTPSQLWATVDGGAHWLPQALPAGMTIADLDVRDGQPLVAAISGGQPEGTAVVLTEQAGRWTVMPGVTVPEATNAWLTSTGMAAWLGVARLPGALPSSQTASLFVTTDGLSWAQTALPPCPTPAVAIPAAGQAGGLALVCSPGTIGGTGPTATALSHDGSRSWDPLLAGPTTGIPTALATADGTTLLMGAASGGSWLYRSRDGGVTWAMVLDETSSGGLAWHDLSVLPSGLGVAVLGGGIPAGLGNPDQMYLTHDGGATWNLVDFSGVATATERPTPAPIPSTIETTVIVPLGGTHAVKVTVDDESGLLTGARPLVLPAGSRIPASYGDLNIAAWNPNGQPSSEVWLYWGGVICDVTSRLVIGPGAASMTVTEGPRPGCDASNDGRGLVLTFRQAVDASSIIVSLVPAAPFSVQAAGLLDQGHGWALTNQQLAVTSDKGSSWHDVTPSGGFGASNPLGVTFTDPQHGWVAINETFTSPSDSGYGRIEVWRTTDGGTAWSKTELPKAVLNRFGEILPQVQFDFLDATHGFVFLSGNLAKGANDSDLFYTADGGQTWSADRPTGTGHVGIEGNIAFATSNVGVVVNAAHGSGIVVTHDGGRSWADAVFALPPGSAGAQLFFGQPVFAGGGAGVVAVDVQTDTGSTTHVYRTTDAGSTWTDVLALPAGSSWVSVIDQQHWVVISDSAVRHTDDGGATWTETAAVPPTSHAAAPQFVDDNDGWWVAGDYLDAPLYATADGGVTWQALAP